MSAPQTAVAVAPAPAPKPTAEAAQATIARARKLVKLRREKDRSALNYYIFKLFPGLDFQVQLRKNKAEGRTWRVIVRRQRDKVKALNQWLKMPENQSHFAHPVKLVWHPETDITGTIAVEPSLTLNPDLA